MPIFEVQDDGMIDFMHLITIMTFSESRNPDEVIKVNKLKGQTVQLRNIVRGPI
jgi:hypothetical protein